MIDHVLKNNTKVTFKCKCGTEVFAEEEQQRVKNIELHDYASSYIGQIATNIMLEHSKYCEFKGEVDVENINNLARLEERVS